MRVFIRLALVGVLSTGICLLAVCDGKERTRPAPPPDRSLRTPGPPLSRGDIETLVSKALRVAIAKHSDLASKDTILVLNTAIMIYRPPEPNVSDSLTEKALPVSEKPRFLLLSRDRAYEMRATMNLHYVEIYSISVEGDQATVDVIYWSAPSLVRGYPMGLGSGDGPMVVFRRSGDGWTFLNADMWHNVN